MDEKYFKHILSMVILVLLIVLSFFLLRPILLSIIVGVLLAFLFIPAYDWLYKRTKMKNFSAGLICLFLITLILLPMWFLTPILIDQSFKVYVATQEIDFISPLKNVFPSLFASEEFSQEIGSMVSSFVTQIANSLVNLLSKLILNFPAIFMQLIVAFFTFFFVLRDNKSLGEYLKSIHPFSKEIEKKLFKSTKDITISVIYGQIIVGVIQGLIVSLGFFIFQVPNALLLSLLAILAGIFPIIGTTIIWLPTAIYLLMAGNVLGAVGVTAFGFVSTIIDNFIRPIIVAKRTELSASLILIGMIGGLFFLGIFGLILGPLILAYLLILLEIYRKKRPPRRFIESK